MNMIREAMDIMAVQGFTKGMTQDSAGRVCVYGALNIATTGDACNSTQGGDELLEIVGQVALEQYPKRAGGMGPRAAAVVVNNHPDTTKGEMLVIMDKAAVLLDEQV